MPEMHFVSLDFESFYSKDFSLSKISTRDYCTDPRFEAILVAIKVDDGPSMVFEKPHIAQALAMIDWSTTALVAHNARFDASILAYQFNIHPVRIFCTMAMAQATVFPHTGSASLAKVSQFFGLPPKGTAVTRAIGKTYASFSATEMQEYKDYCAHDNDLCKEIFNRIMKDYEFPPSELDLIHHNVECYTKPILELDAHILAEHLSDVRAKKDMLINNALLISDCSMDDLGSNPKFAKVLEGLGVQPPRKISVTTGKPTWAFAKSDWAFKELQDHDDPRVQALMSARFGSKSTLEESRTERLLGIANLHGTLHVPLKYAGAHTLRFSGDEKLNLQNLTRGSRIRDAIKAPPGYKLIAADASQIEARVLAVMAEQWDLVDQFKAGEDVYANFASKVFGKVIHKDTHPKERFIGKVGVLSLGYGCGFDRFFHMLRMSTNDRELKKDTSDAVVDTYREEYDKITGLWKKFDNFIKAMQLGNHFAFGPLRFEGTTIRLPNNTCLQYPSLMKDANDEWIYSKRMKKLYGAKLVENVTQALARIITLDVVHQMSEAYGGVPRFVLSVHDELVFVVPEGRVNEHLNHLTYLMKRPPKWMEELPLDAEGGYGDNYGEVK